MKRSKCLTIILAGVCVIFNLVFPVWGIGPQPEPPDIKTIALSKGTEVEKVSPGLFRFKLPDGKVVEVKGLARSSQGGVVMFKECRIYDRAGKLIASGVQGTLKGGVAPSDQSKAGIIGDAGSKTSIIGDTGSFVKIDDDVTWLPAAITYKSTKMKNKP